MGIPESRLETWSHDGATKTAEATHLAIRRALNSYTWPEGLTFDDYLQGSYRNSTTIRSDSDVDIVVELTSVFYSNKYGIFTPAQTAYHESTYSDGDYSWWNFHAYVLQVLSETYGSAVEAKSNAIKVAKAPGRLAADVVVCAQYRRYVPNASAIEPYYDRGITFWANQTDQVVNFPRQHYDNGAAKNAYARTRNDFKPMVRVFKNARRYMVDNGMLMKGTAPSYFIQCLLYNVPDSLFLGTYQDAYVGIVNWLVEADLPTFICQNGITPLFGATPDCWRVSEARAYIQGLVSLWNDWS